MCCPSSSAPAAMCAATCRICCSACAPSMATASSGCCTRHWAITTPFSKRSARPAWPSSNEPASIPLCPGGRAPQPQPDRNGQGAVHVTARGVQGHPGTRRGTGRRHLLAPRQAPAPHHRARPAGAGLHRDHPARGGQSEAHRRGVFAPGQRHLLDRNHPHTGPLCAARAGRPAAQEPAAAAHQPAPGQPRPGRQDAAGRERRPGPGHRIAGPISGAGHPALLRMAACDGGAARAPAGDGRAHQPRSAGGRAAGVLPPQLHRPHAH
mmetsp:Transcript_44683/g.105129  ORF Transcript_44683/g.105129 Transcript_44683/m.105129 type:complete len:266 (+) Transcript_44683:111-908(+)